MKNHYSVQGDYRHLCIDGKEMRGSGRASGTNHPQRNYAMLNIYEAASYTVIECEPIDKKENEIPVAQRLLRQMNLKNTVIMQTHFTVREKPQPSFMKEKASMCLLQKRIRSSCQKKYKPVLRNIQTKSENTKKTAVSLKFWSFPKAMYWQMNGQV